MNKKAIVEQRVNEYITKANEVFKDRLDDIRINVPPIKFSAKMTKTGGGVYARGYRNGNNWIAYKVQFSVPFLVGNEIEEFDAQVIKHEVAHIVDIALRGRTGHDYAFNMVHMRLFGVYPSRCHSLQIATEYINKKYYKYSCKKCGTVIHMTAIKHKRMTNGIGYIHSSCKGELQLVG